MSGFCLCWSAGLLAGGGPPSFLLRLQVLIVILALSWFLAQGVPGPSCSSLVLGLESATSPRSPHFFWWRIVFKSRGLSTRGVHGCCPQQTELGNTRVPVYTCISNCIYFLLTYMYMNNYTFLPTYLIAVQHHGIYSSFLPFHKNLVLTILIMFFKFDQYI